MPIYFLAVTQPFYKTILCLRKDLVNGQDKTKQLSQSWKVVHFLFTCKKTKAFYLDILLQWLMEVVDWLLNTPILSCTLCSLAGFYLPSLKTFSHRGWGCHSPIMKEGNYKLTWKPFWIQNIWITFELNILFSFFPPKKYVFYDNKSKLKYTYSIILKWRTIRHHSDCPKQWFTYV